MKEQVNYTHLRAGRFNSTNQQHLKILSLCKQIGWVKLSPTITRKPVADIERLGAWILKYGHIKKRLLDYSPAETTKLINQLEKVLEHKVL